MNKTQLKKIRDTLVKKQTLVFDQLTKSQKNQAFKFNDLYKTFLDQSKTEREATRQIVKTARDNGFVNIDTLISKNLTPKSSKKYQTKKVYKVFQDRCVALAVLGKDSLVKGTNIIASHLDSPRLDLKQNPVYEDLSMGLLKTHYYGGIRKYHWLAVPLALHGTIVTANGTMDITIGESLDDPVFTVTDLLPHLAGKLQANKKLSEAFEGEKLNLIAGSIPLGGKKEKDRFKLGVLNLLYEKYKITEEDFVSAEIEAVPAEKARDIGFDRSMIGSYGQDDRVCAYTSFKAILDTLSCDRTAVALFFDKEEIGSEGSSGAKSNFLEDFMSDLLFIRGQDMGNRSLRKA
ncbi:MAG: aminopeptidase, partial [Desulfobacula sp.]|nr:aminopeptidase [Desulfobacula sp.]